MIQRLLWTRDQLLLALRLYMRLPFGRLYARNPEIITLANRIGRTPSALAMKACNFASLDPKLRERNVLGLKGASNADRAIWTEFAENPERLAAEAEESFERVADLPIIEVASLLSIPTGDTDILRVIRARRVQSFFRAAVLTSYENRCAITQLATPELLVASHIIPWSESVERRADPANGLCLNALFDRAFDRGLMTFDDKLRLVVSKRLKEAALAAELQCSLIEAEGTQLTLPNRFPPDQAALSFHRERIFRD